MSDADSNAQRVSTSNELVANFELAGVSAPRVCAALGCTSARLAELLTVSPSAKAADVWRLRDHLEQRILAAGGDPIPYTWLTENLRPEEIPGAGTGE